MGYRRTPATERLFLPSNANYWVDMAEFITYGDQKAVGNDAVRIGPSGQAEIDNEKVADLTLLKYVRDWNLDDDNGVKLPITRENLNTLEEIDASALAEYVQGREKRVAAARKNAETTSTAS